MKALITGGTSGIGKEIAKELARRGYDLLLVARKEDDLEEIKKISDHEVTFLPYDLSREEDCYQLLADTKDEEIDVFVSNAGFGDIGRFDKTDIRKEVNMVHVNDIAMLILVKEFLIRFTKKDKGHILMTASAASFGAAGYMNVYYASKAFVYSLAHGYYRELRDRKSKVTLSVLCPGPVKTRFEKRGNMKFNIRSLSAERVGKLAVKKMLKGKLEIVPGAKIKLAHVFSHFVSRRFISKVLNKQAEIQD